MIITGDGTPFEIEIEQTPPGLLLIPVAGRDGTSISIAGTVATYANLPTDLGSAGKGSLYIVEADGLGYVWSGTAWPADGDGIEIRGPQGETGPTGPTGPKGDTGSTGNTGATGPANTLTIGTVTGGASAAATITGAAPAQILSLTLPKGDTGDTGAKGDKGDAGDVSAAQLAAGLATKADLVGGVIPQAQMPAIAVTEFLGAVASQSAMLALTGQRGDWCTRTDLGTDWQLIAEPSSTLANWRERTYPASPVSSVAGRTGAVTLSTADITDLGTVGIAVGKAATKAAARTAIDAVAVDDTRLSNTRTPTVGTVPYDTTLPGASDLTTRAVGYNDCQLGIKLQRAVTFSKVTFRCLTADASGNLVVELRKNGTTVSGTSTTIAAANQVAGASTTGTWSFADGDILTVYVTSVGTTPGKGLIADLKGLA